MLTDKDRLAFYKDKKIIGIDPGNAGGGIAVYSITQGRIIETVYNRDLTPRDLYDMFKCYRNNCSAYLERVGGMPGQSGMGMFRFGKNVGHLEMALIANGIPFEDLLPQVWQKSYNLGVRGKRSKTEWKNVLKSHAQQLYPSIKITNEIADAILLMEYGRRKESTI